MELSKAASQDFSSSKKVKTKAFISPSIYGTLFCLISHSYSRPLDTNPASTHNALHDLQRNFLSFYVWPPESVPTYTLRKSIARFS